jgi:hypothetical protein
MGFMASEGETAKCSLQFFYIVLEVKEQTFHIESAALNTSSLSRQRCCVSVCFRYHDLIRVSLEKNMKLRLFPCRSSMFPNATQDVSVEGGTAKATIVNAEARLCFLTLVAIYKPAADQTYFVLVSTITYSEIPDEQR